MLSQDGAGIWLDLAEGDCSHPGSFESEAETADAAEEVEDIQTIACFLYTVLLFSFRGRAAALPQLNSSKNPALGAAVVGRLVVRAEGVT